MGAIYMKSMGGHGWAWMDMGGHRSLLMVIVWIWVKIQRKMLGSGYKCTPSHPTKEYIVPH